MKVLPPLPKLYQEQCRIGIADYSWEDAHLVKALFNGRICYPTVQWFASPPHVIILLQAVVYRNHTKMGKKVTITKFLIDTNMAKWFMPW